VFLRVVLGLGIVFITWSLFFHKQVPAYQSTLSFKPDIHITRQTDEDKKLSHELENLIFEISNPEHDKNEALQKAYTLGAQKISLITEDNVKISALYFENEKAPLNIIYVTGYFHYVTPPKEWLNQFACLFTQVGSKLKYNILAFDWRGVGESEGSNKLFQKNAFGSNAYKDVQAAIDFIKTKNNKPIMLHGFCYGAAMALHATIKAQEHGKPTADALGLSSVFVSFESMFDRSIMTYGKWFYKLFHTIGLTRFIMDWMMNGSLFDLKPIEMIKKINMPCWFDHFSSDKIASLDEAAAVYQHANHPKIFVQSDSGRHVRIHQYAPCQYRDAYENFLQKQIL